MDKIKRGVAICHYNRIDTLSEIVEAVKKTSPVETRVVLCDDGSTVDVEKIAQEHGAILVKGPNLGVGANKNRALWAMQDCHFACIIEDDIKPIQNGWFEMYEKASMLSGIHHFCRVQGKEIREEQPDFGAFMKKNGLTPIYSQSPRGDLTFFTKHLINTVGAFNPRFRGAGYAHGEWSERAKRAGLICHPRPWIDIKEARDIIVQTSDCQAGRWDDDQSKIKKQLQRNNAVLRELQKKDYIYCPLVLQ